MDHPVNFQAPTGTAVPPPMRDAFFNIGTKMRAAHETHLGYPYNLAFSPGVPADLGQYLINNLGDPYAGSHYGSEVCAEEREAITWLMRLWGCLDPRPDLRYHDEGRA